MSGVYIGRNRRMGSRLFHLGVCLIVLPIAGVWIGAAAEPSANIVINEIHYNSADNTVPGEFIELYNPSPACVNLTGWRLGGGIRFDFPTNSQGFGKDIHKMLIIRH